MTISIKARINACRLSDRISRVKCVNDSITEFGQSPICPTFEQDDSYVTSYKGKIKREGGEENLFKRDGRKGNRLGKKWDRLGFVIYMGCLKVKKTQIYFKMSLIYMIC